MIIEIESNASSSKAQYNIDLNDKRGCTLDEFKSEGRFTTVITKNVTTNINGDIYKIDIVRGGLEGHMCNFQTTMATIYPCSLEHSTLTNDNMYSIRILEM